MKTNQLARLDKIAKEHDSSASVTYSKRSGYILDINKNVTVLGKDSIAALFRLEKILKSYASL